MLSDARDRHDVASGRAGPGVLQGVAGRGISFVLAYIATILLARHLGPGEYGVYGVIISVLLWIEQTGRFAIPQAAAKLIPEDRNRAASVEEAALVLGALLFALLFVLLWVAAVPLADLFGLGERGIWLFRIAALDLPLFGLYAVYRGVLQGHRSFLSLSVADVVYTAGKLLAVVLVVTLWVSVSGALLTNLAASLCGLAYLVRRVTIRPRRPSGAAGRALAVLALPLGLYMLALQTVTSLDLWSLKMLDPGQSGSVGVYVAARNLAVVPGVVLMVVSDILLPSLSRALASGEPHLPRMYIRGAVRFLLIVGIPAGFVLMWSAEDLMRLLYSQTFESGGRYVRVLVLYAAALPFMDLFASALSAKGEPYRGGVTLLFIVPFVLAVNVLLIRSYGPIGAAYGSAAAGLISAFVLGAQVARRFGSPVTRRTFSNVALASVSMAAVGWLDIAHSLPLAACTIGLVVYALALIALREIGRADLEPLAFWNWGVR